MRELDERARGCERRPASPNHRTNAGKKYREKRSRPRPWRKSEKYRPSSASNARSRGFSETREPPGARYFRARDQRSKRRGGFDSSARVGIRAIGENRNRSLDGIRSGRSAARFISYDVFSSSRPVVRSRVFHFALAFSLPSSVRSVRFDIRFVASFSLPFLPPPRHDPRDDGPAHRTRRVLVPPRRLPRELLLRAPATQVVVPARKQRATPRRVQAHRALLLRANRRHNRRANRRRRRRRRSIQSTQSTQSVQRGRSSRTSGTLVRGEEVGDGEAATDGRLAARHRRVPVEGDPPGRSRGGRAVVRRALVDDDPVEQPFEPVGICE